MTINAHVCRNLWVSRVLIIVYWKKFFESFDLYDNHICSSFNDIFLSNLSKCILNSAAYGPRKKAKKMNSQIKHNILSHIIYWYLNLKIQKVLALNLLYVKSTKLYNIIGVSRYSWLCTVNRGRPFISNPLFTFSISVYRTVEKIKDALHMYIYTTPVKIRRLYIRLVL